MKLKHKLFLLYAFLILSSQAKAALIIEISGIAGSNVINYTASGSITITSLTSTTSNAIGRAPRAGVWESGFDNNLGDFILTGNTSALNLALTNAISYQLNSIEFGKIEAFDIGATETAGGDDFEIDMLGTISYPALIIGDVISWSGSGTFSLSGLNTFDTYFEPGTYSSTLDGGDFDLIISPIPEPSSTALLGLAGLACILRRRR
jgi:hypothetical protein